MRKSGWGKLGSILAVTVCVAELGFTAGCGGAARTQDGGGASDGGAVDASADAFVQDAGEPVDAHEPDAAMDDAATVAADAGGCGTDAGAGAGDCVLYVPVGSFGPLTNPCLPRCTAATGAAWRACTSSSCRNAALDADTTPGVSYYIGSAHITSPLDCAGCVSYQQFHCFSLVCPSQVDSYVDNCIAGGDPTSCDIAIANVDNCLAALSASQEATVSTCYASHDGPESCFACE